MLMSAPAFRPFQWPEVRAQVGRQHHVYESPFTKALSAGSSNRGGFVEDHVRLTLVAAGLGDPTGSKGGEPNKPSKRRVARAHLVNIYRTAWVAAKTIRRKPLFSEDAREARLQV